MTDKEASMPTGYLPKLNCDQRAAVEYGVAAGSARVCGPLLVLAGPGTGKTLTLAHRAAHLIVNGVDPRRVLLLTFTRRAAAEMAQGVRVILRAALGRKPLDLPLSGTFHAIGAALLREYAQKVGLMPSFTILDRADALDLMNAVRRELGLSLKKCKFPMKGTCVSIHSLMINSDQTLERILAKRFARFAGFEAQLKTLFHEYTERKRAQNVLDYDDLLFYWAELLDIKGMAKEIGSRFDHTLVDEYQDTNRLQAKLLSRLKPTGRGLMVFGDDAQAIYSFRAATVQNIQQFPDSFKPAARVIKLEQNYRSTQPILDAANRVIGLANRGFRKNLRSDRRSKQKPLLTTVLDETAQAKHVAQLVLRARDAGTPLKSQAVLFRSSRHSAQLEAELVRRDIPFVKVGGAKLLEAAHVKDVISVLRWCENPRDRIAGLRVLQLLPGIGPMVAAKILSAANSWSSLGDALSAYAVPKKTAKHWSDFVKLIRLLRARKTGWLAQFDLLRRWYEPQLKRLYSKPRLKAGDIAQLGKIAAGYDSRRRLLTELALDAADTATGKLYNQAQDEDYLTLSTIHSAKGLQWKIVHILNVVDGCIPADVATGSAAKIEEERRLLYVAMTRAEDGLNLIVPQQHYDATMSRFIPESIQHLFDCRNRTEPGLPSGVATRRLGATNDVTPWLQQLWGLRTKRRADPLVEADLG